jgi:hypothetical protein
MLAGVAALLPAELLGAAGKVQVPRPGAKMLPGRARELQAAIQDCTDRPANTASMLRLHRTATPLRFGIGPSRLGVVCCLTIQCT